VERESWDFYFLSMAKQAASRSTCVRRQVGAVIAQSNRVRATGYNGAPSGYGHCSDGACPRANIDGVEQGSSYDNCIAIHAEANALLHCETLHREGAVIYCTDFPCFSCAKLISNSGIGRVVYDENGLYEGWEEVRDFMRDCGVRVHRASVGKFTQ